MSDIVATTKWSDLYEMRVDTVPEDAYEFARQKCNRYANNGFGYEGKDYSDLQKSIQIDANAVSDEATCLALINGDPNFVLQVNRLILEAGAARKIFVAAKTNSPAIISGKYKFNQYHGISDHDAIQHMVYEKDKPFADLLLDEADSSANPAAALHIEVKTNVTLKKPSSMHNADIVFLHILGTKDIVIFAPTVSEAFRSDYTYACLGTIRGFGDWKNIRVQPNGIITKW